MTLEECYAALEGDYVSVMSRLIKEDTIRRFLNKFRDKNTMEAFEEAYRKQDYETAFRELHNLKGVSANLGLTRLQESAGELTECFRGVGEDGPAMDVTPLLERLRADYSDTLDALDKTLTS